MKNYSVNHTIAAMNCTVRIAVVCGAALDMVIPFAVYARFCRRFAVYSTYFLVDITPEVSNLLQQKGICTYDSLIYVINWQYERPLHFQKIHRCKHGFCSYWPGILQTQPPQGTSACSRSATRVEPPTCRWKSMVEKVRQIITNQSWTTSTNSQIQSWTMLPSWSAAPDKMWARYLVWSRQRSTPGSECDQLDYSCRYKNWFVYVHSKSNAYIGSSSGPLLVVPTNGICTLNTFAAAWRVMSLPQNGWTSPPSAISVIRLQTSMKVGPRSCSTISFRMSAGNSETFSLNLSYLAPLWINSLRFACQSMKLLNMWKGLNQFTFWSSEVPPWPFPDPQACIQQWPGIDRGHHL